MTHSKCIVSVSHCTTRGSFVEVVVKMCVHPPIVLSYSLLDVAASPRLTYYVIVGCYYVAGPLNYDCILSTIFM
jgi:hypothetical protein